MILIVTKLSAFLPALTLRVNIQHRMRSAFVTRWVWNSPPAFDKGEKKESKRSPFYFKTAIRLRVPDTNRPVRPFAADEFL